jgi:hypothetical protein
MTSIFKNTSLTLSMSVETEALLDTKKCRNSCVPYATDQWIDRSVQKEALVNMTMKDRVSFSIMNLVSCQTVP